jgi:hypothetical protein
MAPISLPSLPLLIHRKLYKTGQTRGADDDVIYQNRVSRTSTVLIPYRCWDICRTMTFENGFIVLISPDEYFADPAITSTLSAVDLALGENTLVFYEQRSHWDTHNPTALGWAPATKRIAPLGGQYVARIAATTSADDGERIIRGFNTTSMKGAGIRVYEYASTDCIAQCRLQLEVLFWLCHDSLEVAETNGMVRADAENRREAVLRKCLDAELLDIDRLRQKRLLDGGGSTVCPLCLERLSAQGFFARKTQAEGREVHDLTVTEINLFHIDELRIGALNHRPYNLGWGHHHCNVVVADAGIIDTLDWMASVIRRNVAAGHLQANDTSI